MNDDEKVCLTGTQIENISQAYAVEKYGVKVPGACPKARRWVKGYFGKKKKEKEEKGIIERHLEKKAGNVIDRFLDKIFGTE